MFDEIKTLFYNQGTPFLLKKQLVKIMFGTFIEQIGETNSSFNFSELELMLSTILSDLMLFLKYIDGLTMKRTLEGFYKYNKIFLQMKIKKKYTPNQELNWQI